MLKKIITSIIIVLLLVAVLGYCHIPVPYKHTVSAFKIDAAGNQIGNTEIILNGTKKASLFRGDMLSVNVGSIDGAPGFEVKSAQYEQHIGEDFLHCNFVIDNITDLIDSILNGNETVQAKSYHYDVCMSKDFDQWLISVSVNGEPKVYYMWSVSGNKTYEQLLEYFVEELPL